MYDQPDISALIDAARTHMEGAIVPAVRADRRLYFQTLVAINVLRIVERELRLGDDHAVAHWQRLNTLLGEASSAPASLSAIKAAIDERNVALCAGIRAGDYDAHDQRGALFAHLKASTIEQLLVANPRFLATLQAEAENPEMDAWQGR